ncbi:MAG: hypothetical protein ACK53L_30130, partial [Pirellulaceae bacterium]
SWLGKHLSCSEGSERPKAKNQGIDREGATLPKMVWDPPILSEIHASIILVLPGTNQDSLPP